MRISRLALPRHHLRSTLRKYCCVSLSLSLSLRKERHNRAREIFFKIFISWKDEILYYIDRIILFFIFMFILYVQLPKDSVSYDSAHIAMTYVGLCLLR